jgi:putative FmdB family regulatory protein
VAFYEFRCGQHGAFDVTAPLGAAPATVACPECGGAASRVYSAPMLTSVPKALAAALDHSEKTRHEPDVVTSLPPRDPRKRTPVLPLTPTLAKLPRPKY